MTTVTRTATIRWLTHPPEGSPRLSVGSKSITALPLSVDREADEPLAASPIELLAGAIGSIFATFVSDALVKGSTQASELVIDVTLTMSVEGEDPVLTGLACNLLARVARIDHEQLDAVARTAIARCIAVLNMRAEAITVSIETQLEAQS
jgi:uncharacterized OsmC-like protein